MILVSLVVNVVVLVPVLWGLASGTQDAAFGPDTSGRRIVVAVYAAILALSVLCLVWSAARLALGPGLLAVQAVYKLATVPVLGPAHPVAVANLAVAALHAVTLTTILLRPG